MLTFRVEKFRDKLWPQKMFTHITTCHGWGTWRTLLFLICYGEHMCSSHLPKPNIFLNSLNGPNIGLPLGWAAVPPVFVLTTPLILSHPGSCLNHPRWPNIWRNKSWGILEIRFSPPCYQQSLYLSMLFSVFWFFFCFSFFFAFLHPSHLQLPKSPQSIRAQGSFTMI